MSEKSTGVMQLDGVDDFRSAAVELIAGAIRQLRILTVDLEPALWGHDIVVERLKRFALSNAHAQIDILVQDPRTAVAQGHPLVHLARRLPSRMSIRVINDDHRPHHAGFLLVDRQGVLFKPEQQGYRGFAHPRDVATVQRLYDEFVELWRYSHISSEFRRLAL